MPQYKFTTIVNGEEISETVILSLDDVEEGRLKRYTENCSRLREAKLLQDLPTITQINWSKTEGLCFSVTEFSYPDLCEALHRARPIFLSREPASFERTCGLVGKIGKGTSITSHLKWLRNTYECGDYLPYFQVSIGEQPLFGDEPLKAWLNGVEYHQDAEKEAIIKHLEKSLGSKTVRGIFVSQLSGRIRAALSLECVVLGLLGIDND